MIVRVLKGRCGIIKEAEDGVVAVELLKKSMEENEPFDFILMDYQMPNMDGATAVKVMRDMNYMGPVIGVTGNAVDKDIQTFLNNGANAVLTKPLDVETLNECLRENGIALMANG